MAIHMEGEVTFSWTDGNIVAVDEAGVRVYLSLRQFFSGLQQAQRLAETIRTIQAADVIKLTARGPMFLVERHD